MRNLQSSIGFLLAMAAAMPTLAQTDAPARVGRDGYRLDVPGVNVPPRPVRPIESPFQLAYRQAGQPRIVVFFNRDITESGRAGVVIRQRETATGQTETRTRTGTPAGSERTKTDMLIESRPTEPGSRSPEATEQRRTESERTVETSVQRTPTGGREALLDEASQWLFESAFNNRFSAERARLVDRAAALRLASLAGSFDPQWLETAAIRQHADVVVLVRGAAMPGSGDQPGGTVYRLTAIDTRNARVITDDVLPPQPGNGSGTAAGVAGEAAALHLLQRLTVAWMPAR